MFELSGSSIAYWLNYLPSDGDTGTLFGVARGIRSDEWRVFTPFALSQEHTGYANPSTILRGAATDVTMTYAQPCWSLATVFRLFLWGYLVFGSAKGLAFFWAARTAAMFLVTYECAKLYTRRNKTVSALVAAVVAFSPITQWWFSVNGTAELFVFGQGIALCAFFIVRHSAIWRKALGSILLAWCLGGYAFILYPAWQVPFFYVFAALTLFAAALGYRESGRTRKGAVRSVLFIGLGVALFVVLAVVCVFGAWDVIQTTLDTAYPGSRRDYGGGGASSLFDYGLAVFAALIPDEVPGNAPELSTVFSLFPLGAVVALLSFRRKRDSFLIVLLLIQAFFIVYLAFGLPELVAKLTLLGYTTPGRIIYAIGFVDILLLIRGSIVLAQSSTLASRRRSPGETFSRHRSLPYVVALVAAAVVTLACFFANRESFRLVFAAMLLLVIFAIIFFLARWLLSGSSDDRFRFASCFVAVVVVSGCCVNPVQRGVECLVDNPAVSMIEEISEQDADALWIAEGDGLGQACIVGGASCINSVNTYPVLERWGELDPSGQYEGIYNRYAHIMVELTESETTFELIQGDYFKVNLNVRDLAKLDVSYVLSERFLSDYDCDEIEFEQVGNAADQLFVYKVKYRLNGS